MKRSTDRILTTHVGSLARPDSLIPILRAKERGQPYDPGDFARLAQQAVAPWTKVVRALTDGVASLRDHDFSVSISPPGDYELRVALAPPIARSSSVRFRVAPRPAAGGGAGR